MKRTARNLSLALAALLAASCGDDRLMHAATGTLKVTVVNAGSDADRVAVSVRCEVDERDADDPAGQTKTVVTIEELTPGTCQARVAALSPQKVPLRSVWVSDVEIKGGQTAEITVDMTDSPNPPPAEICDGLDNDGDGRVDEPLDLLTCSECRAGMERPAQDDERCGTVRCDGLNTWELRGLNTPDTESSCVQIAYSDLSANRCDALGRCKPANGEGCTEKKETVVAHSGLCQTISGCQAGAPTLETAPDGTSCGGGKVCKGGVCGNPVPQAGCADGQREGFVSIDGYPNIAGCSGAWTVPGVTRADLAPTCNRASGDDSANTEGTGCSAADLCQAGWHVCRGKDEVAARTGGKGCQEAAPAGAEDKSLFFAIGQASENSSVCGAAAGDNDVFGCGNLGTALTPDKSCGPLNRVLASMKAGSCGYNEAEPNLGPWECKGGADSHLHEGAVVTKKGCPNGSCSYSGKQVGNSDKGGVLCCRD